MDLTTSSQATATPSNGASHLPEVDEEQQTLISSSSRFVGGSCSNDALAPSIPSSSTDKTTATGSSLTGYGSLSEQDQADTKKVSIVNVGATTSLLPLQSQWRAMATGSVAASTDLPETVSISSHSFEGNGDGEFISLCWGRLRLPISLRRLALELSLYVNLAITLAKLVAYLQTFSLSVLAALLDSVLDVVSQLVLNYTERHSSMQRSSALYPAGASRLEPIGVLTCAALMGMASFEVLKESFTSIVYHKSIVSMEGEEAPSMSSFWSMATIVVMKLVLLVLCNRAANRKSILSSSTTGTSSRAVVQLADPTLEALAQDHWNDALSNTVAAVALLCVLQMPSLWFVDPVGAILISIYIIHSWYETGHEQIEHLTGKAAPQEFLDELHEIASGFDERMVVDCLRAYHFGPKYVSEPLTIWLN